MALYVLTGQYRPPLDPSSHSSVACARVIVSEAMGVFVLVVSVLKLTGPNTSYPFKNNDKLFKYVLVLVYGYLCGMFAPSSAYCGNFGCVAGRALLGLFWCDSSGLRDCWMWALGDCLGCLAAVCLYNQLI